MSGCMWCVCSVYHEHHRTWCVSVWFLFSVPSLLPSMHPKVLPLPAIPRRVNMYNPRQWTANWAVSCAETLVMFPVTPTLMLPEPQTTHWPRFLLQGVPHVCIHPATHTSTHKYTYTHSLSQLDAEACIKGGCKQCLQRRIWEQKCVLWFLLDKMSTCSNNIMYFYPVNKIIYLFIFQAKLRLMIQTSEIFRFSFYISFQVEYLSIMDAVLTWHFFLQSKLLNMRGRKNKTKNGDKSERKEEMSLLFFFLFSFFLYYYFVVVVFGQHVC